MDAKSNRQELFELLERIKKLSVADQLELVGDIVGTLRRDHFTDHEAEAKAMAEFAAEYIANEGWKAPYDIPVDQLSPDQLPPDFNAPR